MPRDDAEHPVKHHDEDEPRVINASIPEWAKTVAAIVTGLVVGLGWVEARFVSRQEFSGHLEVQRADIERLARIQADYAIAERATSGNLGEISERLTTMEADLSWVRQYLDLSKPPPKRANGVGTRR